MTNSANLSWTRKYRPKVLDEYIGNSLMKEKLKRLNRLGRLPQTMLFEGSRGTGKTTMARLLAKAMMCERPIDGEACCECETCRYLDTEYIQTGRAPRNIAIYEFDITSMNRREDANNIVAQMKRRTARGGKRVFILDEVQRATNEAQSSFLKITEEPVEDLYVILCTTDPEDLLTPFKSRFISFRVNRPSATDISERLVTICQNEGVDYTREGLKLLADKTGRIPREAINRAEVIANGRGDLKRATVQQELEIISEEIFHRFITICKTGRLHDVMSLVTDLDEADLDVIPFVEGLGDYIVQLLNVKANVGLEKYDAQQVKKMKILIKGLSDSDIVNLLKVLKEYSSVKRSMSFLLYSLAVEVMGALKVEETVPSISTPVAAKRYTEVTRRTREATTVNTTHLAEASDDDIGSVFETAKRVRKEGG